MFWLFLFFFALAVILFKLGSYSVWITVLSVILKIIAVLVSGWVIVYLIKQRIKKQV